MSWEEWAEYYEKQVRVRLGPGDIDAVRQTVRTHMRNAVVSDTDIRCACPLHHSQQGTPFRISLDMTYGIGRWTCYGGCGNGTWNELADRLGFDPVTHVDDPNAVRLDLLTAPVAIEEMYVPPLGLHSIPNDYAWVRYNENNKTTTRISSFALSVVGARFHGANPIEDAWLWLPVLDLTGRGVAHILAPTSEAERDRVGKKYINSKGRWSKKYVSWLYQVHRGVPGSTLVITEGPADALRLIDAGIPAVPLLGVTSWSDHKAEVIANKYKHAVVCLDGDAAGQLAQAKVLRSLQAVMSATEIRLATTVDPASMSDRALTRFTNIIDRTHQ